MYSISSYGKMVADPTRMEAYSRALRQSIKPSSVVLELGSGSGVFALLACKFGARRVYAIEPDDAILVAEANARANGFSDRIQFIQDLSTRITLPERVNVIVSDLRGILPLFQNHLPSIADARHRFLLPGGIQIPLSDRILLAPVEAPREYKSHVLGHDSRALGLDVEAAIRHTCNTQYKVDLQPAHLLAEPQLWAALDYRNIQKNDYAGTLNWTMARAGLCHGLVIWFDTVLAEGIFYSNAPGQPCDVYRQLLLPWPRPVELNAGDCITVELKADLVAGEYLWRWDSSVIDPKRPSEVKAAFQQSSFFGIPRDPARFRKRTPQHVPNLNEDGQIDRYVLNAMDGAASVQVIAQGLQQLFPGRFPTLQTALEWAASLSIKYSK